MRFEGLVKSWNDDRGFGFIEPSQGGQEIFVHIKAFSSGAGRPAPNLKVSFEVEQSADGKKRAKNVMLMRRAGTTSGFSGRAAAPWPRGTLIVLAAFALTYLMVTLLWGTRLYLALAYLGMSLVCATAYWMDKRAAQTAQWRISESTLLLLGALGGWPGAIIAQQTLRHKTSKTSFQAGFWLTVGVNVLAFIALTTPLGRFVGA